MGGGANKTGGKGHAVTHVHLGSYCYIRSSSAEFVPTGRERGGGEVTRGAEGRT